MSGDSQQNYSGMPPVNPFFMPMYYPQYMAGMPSGYGMGQAIPGYQSHDLRASQDKTNNEGRSPLIHHQSMPIMPMPHPMSYMPMQPMVMPGYYPQPTQQFSYSRSYFYPNQPDKQKKEKRNHDEDEEDSNDDSKFHSKNKIKAKPKQHKSTEQIVQEFKAYTLPKLRLKRLVKIQAVWRGWHVRNKKMPRKRLLHRMCAELTERKIDEFVEVMIIEKFHNNCINRIGLFLI